MGPVDFVKKVGRGKTLSQDLSPEESREAFTLLLDGGFAPAQFGAFLQALRIKELTQEELDALATVCFGRMERPPALAGPHTLALNLSSDTARKGGLASLLAAHLLGRLGVGVGVVHSDPVLTGNVRSFDDTMDLADALEAGANRPAEDPPALPMLIASVSDLLPGLKDLNGLRGQLGFRSCLHTAEKLLNPWPQAPLVLGISHKHYALRIARALAALGLRGVIVLGNHGTPDLVLHKETELVTVRGGDIREETVAPEPLGLRPSADVYALGKFPLWREWLARREPGLMQTLHYHLGFLLWAAEAAPDPAAGLALARAQLPTFFA